HAAMHSFPTRRSSDLIDGDHVLRGVRTAERAEVGHLLGRQRDVPMVLHEEFELPAHVVDVAHARTSARDSWFGVIVTRMRPGNRSEEHTSELQSRFDL